MNTRTVPSRAGISCVHDPLETSSDYVCRLCGLVLDPVVVGDCETRKSPDFRPNLQKMFDLIYEITERFHLPSQVRIAANLLLEKKYFPAT